MNDDKAIGKAPLATRLRSSLTCPVIGPNDPEYDSSRTVFYGWVDRRPAAIVKVASAADVASVIAFARDSGIPLAVRSGGHSGLGHCLCDDGIVIDLSELKSVEIDANGRTAWAGTGLTAGQYLAATAERGLATGFGDTGSVGIGGITLGGGIGFLVRKYGMTIDNLLAAEVVTADGKLIRTDAERDPDLFWAIRGGGGNFGVATRFRFKLQEVDRVVGGMLFLPATADTVTDFIAEAQSAPEELSVIANVGVAPPMPFIPPSAHGKPIIMAMMVHCGPVGDGERAVARLRSIATPVADMVRPMRYLEMFQAEGPHPTAASSNTMFMDRFDRKDAVTIVDALGSSTATMAVAQIRVLGGAMARVARDATAFAFRDRKFLVNVAALYESPADAAPHDTWVQRLSDALRKGDRSGYVNFLSQEGEALTRTAYPARTYERLASIKAIYDPENLFSRNHNIKPGNVR